MLVLTCVWGCARFRDPQAAFDHATQTFRHGDIGAAAIEAEKGYQQFHNVGVEWAWRFRVLQAKSLVWQGKSEIALALLSSEPARPSSGDVAVQERRLESSAYLALDRLADADLRIQEAERLCAVSETPACANVILDRGGLEMERGHFPEAERLFEQTLAFARVQVDQFLEASALLALSHSALQQEHFDAASEDVCNQLAATGATTNARGPRDAVIRVHRR